MDSILVTGNGPLHGVIPIAGAKNACLTLMPATLLSEEPLTLTNAPRLSDIATMTQLLQSLGSGYNQRVHFIGHSLGTISNAYACDYAHGSFGKCYPSLRWPQLYHPAVLSKLTPRQRTLLGG